MNVPLLRKIQQVIRQSPQEFNMLFWHLERGHRFNGHKTSLSQVNDLCGTSHCIAGWAQVLDPAADPKQIAWIDAQRLLGLSDDQADRLFFFARWPEKYNRLSGSIPSRVFVEQACARIDHFITTDGNE